MGSGSSPAMSLIATIASANATCASAGVGVRYFRERVSVVGATAAEFETGEGSCNGDSGGPIVKFVTDNSSYYEQIGNFGLAR